MRDCIQEILDFNKGFDRPSLRLKLQLMGESAFSFFRATFHLFAADMRSGPFQKLPTATSHGRIVADLHTENFGGYRAVSEDLVYDINDFDDATESLYEFDLRRVLTSLVLGGTESGLRVGQTVNSCETAVHSYLKAITQFRAAKNRAELADLKQSAIVRVLLQVAQERPHLALIQKMVEARPKGGHQFISGTAGLAPLKGSIRMEVEKRFPDYLATALLPVGTTRKDFAVEDVVFRFAGKGSLGKNRFSLLVRQGEGLGIENLRILEWKDSSDSPLTSSTPSNRKGHKKRNREVCDATVAFQVNPRAFLGYVSLSDQPMQARELGANDCRFDHSQYADAARLEQAAEVFGGITARAHLLASLQQPGPRNIVKDSGVDEDRFAGRLVSFATSYATRVREDYAEFQKRRPRIAKAWN